MKALLVMKYNTEVWKFLVLVIKENYFYKLGRVERQIIKRIWKFPS
jgi:hypothetical protein